jgi:hypothetical protein
MDKQAYFQAQVTKFATMADGSANLTLNIGEAFKNEMGQQLLTMDKKVVKVLLSQAEITTQQVEIVKEAPVVSTGKKRSDSQQLRDSIYHLFNAKGLNPADWDDFYKKKMSYFRSLVKIEIDNERGN